MMAYLHLRETTMLSHNISRPEKDLFNHKVSRLLLPTYPGKVCLSAKNKNDRLPCSHSPTAPFAALHSSWMVLKAFTITAALCDTRNDVLGSHYHPLQNMGLREGGTRPFFLMNINKFLSAHTHTQRHRRGG